MCNQTVPSTAPKRFLAQPSIPLLNQSSDVDNNMTVGEVIMEQTAFKFYDHLWGEGGNCGALDWSKKKPVSELEAFIQHLLDHYDASAPAAAAAAEPHDVLDELEDQEDDQGGPLKAIFKKK